MKAQTTFENKQLTPALENKQGRGLRVPTGQVDAELRVRRIEDGPVPQIDVRLFRRSPADVSADAFQPTAQGVTIEAQFADELLKAIEKVRAA